MFIASVESGLGNRIKAMVSSLRINPDARVNWPSTPGILDCPFSELFKNNIEAFPPWEEGSVFYVSWRLAVLPEDDIPAGFAQVQTGCPEGFSFSDPTGRNIDFEYSRIPQSMRDIYIPCFQKLVFSDTIQREVDAFSSQFDESTVSVQIRTWRDDMARNQHLHRLDRYLAKMNVALNDNPETKFYVTSDDDATLAYLNEKFPNRICFYPRGSVRAESRSCKQGIIDDLIEMILLSKNNILIGTHISSYCEVAWWLGGCKARPIIV